MLFFTTCILKTLNISSICINFQKKFNIYARFAKIFSMKKFISLFLIMIFTFASLSAIAAPKKKAKKPKIRTKVEIEAKDGFLLEGDLYFAPQKKPPRPLVVLLHSFGGKASDWGTLPESLRLKNYNVLTIDLRGHGKSVYTKNFKFKSRMNFTKDDWVKYPVDVVCAIDFIRKNYPNIDSSEIYIVGADIGANSAVLASSVMRIKPKKMVLISPYVSFKNLDIALTVPRLTTVPMMIMASKADKYSYSQTDIISRLVHSKMTLKLYEQGGSGILLLKRNPSSYNEIINYISGK